MAAAKPTQPPAFDASTAWSVLRDELRKGDAHVVVDGVKHLVVDEGDEYQVFQDKAFPRWKRWVDGTAEYDGSGLRDTVDANAQYLDAVKNDVDALNDREAAHHAAQAARLTALEAAIQNPPFPA